MCGSWMPTSIATTTNTAVAACSTIRPSARNRSGGTRQNHARHGRSREERALSRAKGRGQGRTAADVGAADEAAVPAVAAAPRLQAGAHGHGLHQQLQRHAAQREDHHLPRVPARPNHPLRSSEHRSLECACGLPPVRPRVLALLRTRTPRQPHRNVSCKDALEGRDLVGWEASAEVVQGHHG